MGDSVKKKTTLAALKRKCDKVFSEHIRQMDADRYGETACITCGIRRHWRELQCGHFISRVYLSTRYSLENCHVQCGACNVLRRGNMAEYASYIQRAYGYGVIESLLAEKRKTVRFSRADYERMIGEFS